MPHYAVHAGAVELEGRQREALARQITELHCERFGAASLFVRVTFEGARAGEDAFVAGERHRTNSITAHLRPRPTAPPNTLPDLVTNITTIWNRIVRKPDAQYQVPAGRPGRLDDPRALHNVFIMEDISAGAEQGFILPKGGQDRVWAEQNWGEFEERARQGDKAMEKLLRELEMKKAVKARL